MNDLPSPFHPVDDDPWPDNSEPREPCSFCGVIKPINIWCMCKGASAFQDMFQKFHAERGIPVRARDEQRDKPPVKSYMEEYTEKAREATKARQEDPVWGIPSQVKDSYIVRDSGHRKEYPSGARRDRREGKGRFDLISPIMLRRLARHYELGAAKYGDHNWQRGIPLHDFLDSAKRHINDFELGDREEDHLSAAIWNLACIIHLGELIDQGVLPEELDTIQVPGGPVQDGLNENPISWSNPSQIEYQDWEEGPSPVCKSINWQEDFWALRGRQVANDFAMRDDPWRWIRDEIFRRGIPINAIETPTWVLKELRRRGLL